MLGSPVGGTNYLFVDPTSVFRRETSPERRPDARDDGVPEEVGVRVLLPSQGTMTYSPSHQHAHSPRLLPGFRKRRTIRLKGWDVYAIDGWVVDRSRAWVCVLARGEGREPQDGEGTEEGAWVDEYVPEQHTKQQPTDRTSARDGEHTDPEDDEVWDGPLTALRAAVEADGGRLEELAFDIDHPSSLTANTTTSSTPASTAAAHDRTTLRRGPTYIPHTPLPYLPHGLVPIHIPGGNYAQVRDELGVNLGLRRFGCSGRSWVGLGRAR